MGFLVASKNELLLWLAGPLLLSAGCNGDLSVDLLAAPTEGASEVVVEIEGAELLSEDGDLESLTFEDAEAVDLLDYTESTYRIVTGEEAAEGSYTGVRVAFNGDGHYRVDEDGDIETIEIESASTFADVEFDIEEDTEESVTVVLDLRLSLYEEDGVLTLDPFLRAVAGDDGATIEGLVSEELIRSDACRDNRVTGEGVAIYLFEGLSVTPDDYDEIGVEPVATAGVELSSSSGDYEYRFEYLQEGDYTVALTCSAQEENGLDDDEVSFLQTASESVDEDETATVNFTD